MNFYCGYFNNPVTPTHILDCYFEFNGIEILVMHDRVRIHHAYGFPDKVDKDTPAVVLYLKTDTDFSKMYPDLNEYNSTYLYKVFRDSVDSAGIYYRIIYSSVKSDTTETTFFHTNIENRCIEIKLNNELMGNPKRFLWQTYIKEFSPYNTLPPDPYAYCNTNK